MKESKHPSLFNKQVSQTLLFVLALLVSLMFVPSSFAAGTIKIGQLDPASGTFKTTGDQYNAAIEQAVFDINQKGGVLGKKVELIWRDGMMKPEVATREALRLIQKDKVDFLVGGTGSHVYLALEKLADQYKKIVVCTGATSDDLTGKGFSRYFFRPGITNSNTTFSIAKYLAKQPYTKYYSIHQDYAFGHDMARIFREKLTSLNPNAKIVGEDFTPVGNKDYNPYLSKIAASGAEVVFVSHIGGDGQVLLKQAAEMGLTKSKQFALFYYDSITAELLGASLEGTIVTHSYGITIDSPLNRSFIKRYHERHKSYPSTHMQYPDSFFGNAYFGMMFLFAAIEKAGSLDSEKIIKAWEGMQFEYPQGKVTMRACDHQLIAPMSIYKVVRVPEKEKFFNLPYYISKPVVTFTGEETAIPMNTPGYNPRCK